MSKAVILLSGGQDSTTALTWAKTKFKEVHAVFFDYGQRHKIELESAKKIAQLTKTPLKILPMPTYSHIGGSSLTSQSPIEQGKEYPNSFVPGRNLVFITLASAYAYSLGISNVITGVSQTDYSGYPDCREDSLNALEATLRLGLAPNIKIHSPLMHMTKTEEVKYMQEQGELELLAYTHTCYEGRRPPCGKCPSCVLRAAAFEEVGIQDPLLCEGVR